MPLVLCLIWDLSGDVSECAQETSLKTHWWLQVGAAVVGASQCGAELTIKGQKWEHVPCHVPLHTRTASG